MLTGVVSEPGAAQRRAIWRRHRWRDAFAAEYHRGRRALWRKNRYRRWYFSADHDDFELGLGPSVLVVPDINDHRVVELVQRADADVCVIACTTRLLPETIKRIAIPIINIHGGHLPDFRGCHCFFTAISDRRFDAIGSTLHFVDAGLDTGDIIEVVRPAILSTDDAERLYSRAERLAAQRLVSRLEDLERGIDLPRAPQAFRGKLILRRHRTPIADLRHWMLRKTGRLIIPNLPGPFPRHPLEPLEPDLEG
jgi:hypothetical protein